MATRKYAGRPPAEQQSTKEGPAAAALRDPDDLGVIVISTLDDVDTFADLIRDVIQQSIESPDISGFEGSAEHVKINVLLDNIRERLRRGMDAYCGDPSAPAKEAAAPTPPTVKDEEFAQGLVDRINNLVELSERDARLQVARDLTRILEDDRRESSRQAVEADRALAGRRDPRALEQSFGLGEGALAECESILQAIARLSTDPEVQVLASIGRRIANEGLDADPAGEAARKGARMGAATADGGCNG